MASSTFYVDTPTPTLTCLICSGTGSGSMNNLNKEHGPSSISVLTPGLQRRFVYSKNGHVFHDGCVRYLIDQGIATCPACDEDLRTQIFALAKPPQLPNYLRGSNDNEPENVRVPFAPAATSTPNVNYHIGTVGAKFAKSQENRNTYPTSQNGISGSGQGRRNGGGTLRQGIESRSASMAAADTSIESGRAMTMTNVPSDYTFKVALLGDLGVGKSSLMERFCDEALTTLILCVR